MLWILLIRESQCSFFYNLPFQVLDRFQGEKLDTFKQREWKEVFWIKKKYGNRTCLLSLAITLDLQQFLNRRSKWKPLHPQDKLKRTPLKPKIWTMKPSFKVNRVGIVRIKSKLTPKRLVLCRVLFQKEEVKDQDYAQGLFHKWWG